MQSMDTLPSLFISHGSPMIALEPGAAGAFLARLGPAIARRFGRPRAVLAVSAHTAARTPVLLAGAQHEAVYDFGGFPAALSQLRYDAPGEPALATGVAQRLEQAGIAVQRVDAGGLDHGIWTVMRYLWPEADLPVLPLAFVPSQSPEQQFALGEAMAGLRSEGVLILGSGSITHNLRRVFAARSGMPALDAPEAEDSAAFRRWFAERSAAADWPALFDYRRQAPAAVEMHPTDEHLLPWYVAAGAGGRATPAERLHDSLTYGVLGMDVYAFGAEAEALREATVAA